MTLTLIAAGLGVTPSASAVDTPGGITDITIPATMRTTPGTSSMMSAGSTGFLHSSTTSGDYGLDWTTYDGVTHRIEGGDGKGSYDPIEHYGADSDIVAMPPAGGIGDVALRDMATGRSWTITVPAGQTYAMTLADTVVTYGPRANGTTMTEIHLLRAENGVVTDRPVTGLPEGASFYTGARGTAQGLLPMLHMPGTGFVRWGWVDLATARLTLLPEGTLGTPLVADGRLVNTERDGVHIYAAGNLDAAERVVPIPRGRILGVVGDALVVGRYDPAYGAKRMDAAQWRISAVPFDGSAERELVARAVADRVAVRPDGGLVVMGGSSALEYGFRAITAQGTGEAHVVPLHPIAPVPFRTQRLLMDRGRVDALEYGDERTAVYSRELAATAPGYGPRVDRGGLPGFLADCGRTELKCPELVATGDGRIVYRSTPQEQEGTLSVVAEGGSFPGTQWKTGFSGSGDQDEFVGTRVRAASGNLVLVTGKPAGGERELRVIDIDKGTVVRKEPIAVAALWGTTLWTASRTATAGKFTVTARQARTGATLTTATVGAACTSPNDLQAVGEWLYWKCDIAGAPYQAAGVYNVRTRKNVPLADVGTAQLGNGVVVVDGARATRYDVHGGTAVGQKLDGTAPSLDPRTGDIALRQGYGVRVVRAGLPAVSLTSPYSAVTAVVETDSTPVAWRGEWWLSEPVASWTLTVRDKATGRTVATRSGGAAAYSVAASWDGRAAGGGYLPNGPYTWTLTAEPADGAGAALTQSGTVRLTGGAAVRRDYSGDGAGDVLTLNSKGRFTVQRGDGAGKFSGKTTGSGWSTSAVAVPFGDLNNDRCNDVLVRMTDGSLRGYRPGCGKALTPTAPYTKLGTGFQAYKTLTSPGDLTGDGRADLLGWKTSTGDLYLFAAKSDGTLAAGKKIRSKWTYTKIMGVGDLNGDGYGDLLAKDKSNNLWRYNGTASGQFKERVLVFKNWGASYNTIVGVGDITGDGRADLIERDSAGRVFRNNGDGKGSFGGRTQIATGWQTYKGIF
ncbi:FG-GAP-like repeat-containing protein [Streptomyces sp. NPDC058092]|uniref:FG-GAP-like repeat-containing protein n=1 Tax=Streptomyces sp. NPDC058092 TaxID=3346336 RepID=UPI0036E355E4